LTAIKAALDRQNARIDAQAEASTYSHAYPNSNSRGANVSSMGLKVFDETLHKTNMWLKEIAQELSMDRHGAYQVLRAVLHCLRDRLTTNEAADLGDQLPMLIRGIYYEAWRPAGKPDKIRSRDEFLTGITTRIAMKQSIDAENAARAVFRTLENHVLLGEIRHVLHVLPEEVRTLWPPLQQPIRSAEAPSSNR
jgi:uncharacterized protein (DUF2267 family)